MEDVDAVRDAYRVMAKLGYRPAAPSDGFGNITIPAQDLDLEEESATYVRMWFEQEDRRAALIGVLHGQPLMPLVLAIEACRLICAGASEEASRLLRRAVTDLET